MRYSWLFVVTGCGFSAATNANVDAPPMLDDAGREIRMWNFDTAAELGAPGSETIGMTVDPRGSLTPHGYVYGGLVARGVQGLKLWSNTDADWDKLATVTAGGTGFWAGNPLTSTSDLRFIGVTDPTMVTAWFEGEMWLEAPGQTIDAKGNDTAFIYVATDGVNFQKIAHNASGVATVATSGWYPVRVGWSDGDNSGGVSLTLDAGAAAAPIPRTRMRAATSAVQGTLRTVYYRQIHGGGIPGRPPVMSMEEGPLYPASTFATPLPGSVTVSATPFDWSARWTGQFYATTAGSYTFAVASNDGHRIQLGTATPVATNYTRNVSGTVAGAITADLVEGWNDLVVDFNHVNGPPSFEVKITAAPEAALVGATVPADRLRPVEPRGDRLITRSVVSSPGLTVVDDAAVFAELTLRVAGYPNEVVTSSELTARAQTLHVSQLNYRLEAPSGASTTTNNLSETAEPNNSYVIHGTSVLDAGATPTGIWKFGIADNSSSGGNNTTSYEEMHLTIHTSGGPEQIATSSTWRSPIVENATPVALVDSVRWDDRVPAGATLAVRMRTCAVADCSDGVWSDPIAKDTAPMLPMQKYIQIEVAMTSDGTHEPELRSLMVQYRNAAP